MQLSKIKEDFDKVIIYSQGIENPITEDIISQWKEAKRDFINTMGGLIYESPHKISFTLGEKEKNERILHFIESISLNWQYEELATFIDTQKDGFFQNLTVEDYTTWEGKTIKKGTKLVRSFKYFVSNERSLTDIQNEASRIIQEDKIEGTLCLSVHPLDYLSSSETTYNWRSCHSLDGEYRAGNLSYMLDSSTIVCYLKGEDNVKLPNFPDDVLWNSKKWRVLLFFSNDQNMIFAGRQYPFETESGLDVILKNLLPESKLINSSNDVQWTEWDRPFITEINFPKEEKFLELSQPYVPVGRDLKKITDLIKDAPNSRHYNDLLRSSCYKPVFSAKLKRSWYGEDYLLTNLKTEFTLGHSVKCLKCGKEFIIEGGDSMMCEDCELNYGNSNSEMYTYCDCCGDRIFTDDGYIVNDEVFCEHCYSRYCQTCECCGEVFHEDFMRYDDVHDEYICRDCYEERFGD